MKVLLVFALIIAEAFAVNELCALSDDQISALVNCMGDHVSSEIKAEVKDFINEHGDNIVEVIKNLCEDNVDLDETVNRLASADQAEAINKAYAECKQKTGRQ